MDKYIDQKVSQSILTVGCHFSPPKGGVAQLLYIYEKYVYTDFKFCANSKKGTMILKFFFFIKGICSFVYNLIIDRRIKLIHIHSASYNSFRRSAIYVRIAKLFGKKVVFHIHGGDFKNFYNTAPARISKLLNNVDCIIALSEQWKRFFQQIAKGVPVEIVQNIIEFPILTTVDNNKDGKIHVLFLGLIDEAKGVFDLLDVLSSESSLYKDKYVIHIAGNGKVRQLKDVILENKLEDIVKFEGWVDGEKKIELLNLCEVFILPSYAEGSPLSILEALSYGNYIIASNVGGIPEVVSPGCGMLFDAGDKLALSNALKQYIYNRNDILKTKHYRISVGETYLPHNVANKLNSIYNELIK